VAAIEESFWKNLVTALGVPELEHSRFGTSKERTDVTAKIRRVFGTKTRDEWARLLMHKDTCATPVLTVEEALTSDWARALSMLVDLADGETVLNGPIRSSAPMRRRPFTKAPALGQDSPAVLASLGYTRKEIVAMMKKGIVE
jgi:crotonobetainyl-CoA:carnitine CoA-transferase CaiB-like acyl-CoA transferase